MKKLLHNAVVFYSFLCVGVTVFVFSTLAIQLEKRKIFDAVYKGGTFYVEADIGPHADRFFYYIDKKDAIFTADITEVAVHDGKTMLTVKNPDETDEKLTGAPQAHIELVTGHESLFKRVFLHVGKDNG